MFYKMGTTRNLMIFAILILQLSHSKVLSSGQSGSQCILILSNYRYTVDYNLCTSYLWQSYNQPTFYNRCLYFYQYNWLHVNCPYIPPAALQQYFAAAATTTPSPLQVVQPTTLKTSVQQVTTPPSSSSFVSVLVTTQIPETVKPISRPTTTTTTTAQPPTKESLSNAIPVTISNSQIAQSTSLSEPQFLQYIPNNGYASKYWPIKPPYCGETKSRVNYIVGGQNAQKGAWPWIASLGYYNQTLNRMRWQCGGSLISQQHILTAAHCVYKRRDLRVARLGEHDFGHTINGVNPIDIPISIVVYHNQYNPKTFVNDIAILKLRDEVKFTDKIHPICLPLDSEIKDADLVGKKPYVAGWGATAFRGSVSPVLQQVQVPIVSEATCRKDYANLHQELHIDWRVLCAGYQEGGTDACQGDSGGSLMYPHKGVFYSVGVISFGYRCAENGFPGVYTKTAGFLDFILTNLN